MPNDVLGSLYFGTLMSLTLFVAGFVTTLLSRTQFSMWTAEIMMKSAIVCLVLFGILGLFAILL